VNDQFNMSQQQVKQSKLTITQLRKQLKQLSSDELIELVVACYKMNNGVKNLLRAEIVGDRAVEELFYAYRELVKARVFPEGYNVDINLAGAKKAIREFERVSQKHPIYSLELKLYYVELGVQLTTTYGDMYEGFYVSMESMYQKVVDTLVKSEDDGLREMFAERVRAVVQNTEGMGWGFHDGLADIYSDFEDER
jgi:hypothetical protein